VNFVTTCLPVKPLLPFIGQRAALEEYRRLEAAAE
jgi:hypothetical protein